MDFESWKIFKVSDLFDCVLAKGDLKKDDIDSGNIPLISSGESQNGVVKYIDSNGDGISEIFAGNSITVDMFCNAFYQDEDFYAVSHGRVNILLPKIIFNKYIGLFICTLIKMEQYKYSYGRAVYNDEISRMEIKLPVTQSGDIDYLLIEQIMKNLWGGSLETANPFSNINIDPKNWSEFRLGDLFDIEKGKCNCAANLEDGNEVPYLGAKKSQNGVMRFVSRDQRLITKGNCLIFICDGEGSVGYSNYMDRDFIGSTTIAAGFNDNLNKYNALFIVTLLDKEKYKFSYGRKWGPTLKDTKIKLPTTSNFNPDWEFMTKMVKDLPFADLI